MQVFFEVFGKILSARGVTEVTRRAAGIFNFRVPVSPVDECRSMTADQ
jgi:hypothetical protein